MQIIMLVIIGAAAGYIATKIMKVEMDLLPTVAFGIGGALIGGLTLRLVLALTGWAAGIVGAIIGAMVLIWLWQRYGPRS